jgi:hypothetical protein
MHEEKDLPSILEQGLLENWQLWVRQDVNSGHQQAAGPAGGGGVANTEVFPLAGFGSAFVGFQDAAY